MKAENAILVFGMGITQHRCGAGNVQQLANLALLRGNIGRPGAGICPVGGHSNVQGDRTVGITEKPSQELLARLEARFGFTPPTAGGSQRGHRARSDAPRRGQSLRRARGNFTAAVPDWQVTRAAFRTLDLSVQISTKLNRTHVVHGREALILPCLFRTELGIQAAGAQAITVEDSMSMVHVSTGRNPPASDQLRSEPAIVAGIARATLGARSKVDWWIGRTLSPITTGSAMPSRPSSGSFKPTTSASGCRTAST
jgi:anaerobic selenocysteine-containing dehydrogenase